MAAVELTAASFDQTVNDNAIVLIDFWAPWCGPCKNFAPVFEAASQRHPDAVFAKVNTDEQQELSQQIGVRSLRRFDDLLGRGTGAHPSDHTLGLHAGLAEPGHRLPDQLLGADLGPQIDVGSFVLRVLPDVDDGDERAVAGREVERHRDRLAPFAGAVDRHHDALEHRARS